MSTPSLEAIEALLPQTQCGLCGYPGCKPYAEAIQHVEAIHLCPPGGLPGLQALAALTGQQISPLMQHSLQARQTAPSVVRIRPQDCIGCTKCLQACPVDAIVGAAKYLHLVLEDECTGCQLCIAPCPVDCIDLIPVEQLLYEKQRAQHQYQAKLARGTFKRSDHLTLHTTPTTTASIQDKKRFISEAIARVKQKKAEATLTATAHPTEPVELDHEKTA
jgi:electron transport complex protein RnfB